MRKSMTLGTLAVAAGVILGMSASPERAEAGDWSISLWGGHPHHYHYGYSPYRTYYHGPRYSGRYYYPSYWYNPIERRDVYQDGGYAPDGTHHSETTVEDRHSSYYSPGRNQAITRPRTSVQSWDYGPGRQRTRERTSWIGADGRPHSTTIDRDTYLDRWGNSHTDTNVTLKNKKMNEAPKSPEVKKPREVRVPDRPKAKSEPKFRAPEPPKVKTPKAPKFEAPVAPPAAAPGARPERSN